MRSTKALEEAKLAYAVAGDNSVATWVSRVDESAVRNTRDVDILIRRSDLSAVTKALTTAGFAYRHVAGVDVFLDGAHAKAGDGVHVVFANEFVRPDVPVPNPDVDESVTAENFRVVNLEALTRIKLVAYRDKDRTHLRDLLDVGLLDASWVAKFPPVLGARLQALIDTPGG